MITEVVFLGSLAVIGACGAFFWLYPNFDDCLWGRAGLFGMICASIIVVASVMNGYHYHNLLPEVVLAIASQASYMAWLVWRFIRKQWRIRAGRDLDVSQR
jgi:hypothetical protein